MTDTQDQKAQESGQDHGEARPNLIRYYVNDEPQKTEDPVLTPRKIMERAGINPEENYLIEIRGHEQYSYKDRPDEPIKMHEDQRFITIYTGPVHVS